MYFSGSTLRLSLILDLPDQACLVSMVCELDVVLLTLEHSLAKLRASEEHDST